MYANVENNQVTGLRRRPKWLDQDGNPISDAKLIDENIYPVVREDPDYDPKTQRKRQKPMDQWEVKSDHVFVPYEVEDKSVEERQKALKRRAERQLQSVLEAGYADSDDVRWPLTPNARERVLELTQRIQEYRDGKVSTELPNGKDKARLWDAEGNRHRLTPDEIVAISERGTDFKDQAEDRLEELLDQIEAAESHDDLDEIDVESGWPS